MVGGGGGGGNRGGGGRGGVGRGGGTSGGGDSRGHGFDAAVARAVAVALAAAGVQPPLAAAAAQHISSPARGQQRAPVTPPSIVLLKRQIRGLQRAAAVEGVDAVQRRAGAILLGEIEDELE